MKALLRFLRGPRPRPPAAHRPPLARLALEPADLAGRPAPGRRRVVLGGSRFLVLEL